MPSPLSNNINYRIEESKLDVERFCSSVERGGTFYKGSSFIQILNPGASNRDRQCKKVNLLGMKNLVHKLSLSASSKEIERLQKSLRILQSRNTKTSSFGKLKRVVGSVLPGSKKASVEQLVQKEIDILGAKVAIQTEVRRAIQSEVEKALGNLGKIHTEENHIETSIQTMNDDPDKQKEIRNKLDDKKYGKENFVDSSKGKDNSVFLARFGKGDKEEFLEFSNRECSRSEFRGEILKEKLQGAAYKNLRELICEDYLTERDAMLRFAFAPAKANSEEAMERLNEKQQEELKSELSNISIGKTTLGVIFKWKKM